MLNNMQLIQSPKQLIERYREIKANIKHLEAECSHIKDTILKHYMVDTDTLTNDKGFTIATYKSSIRFSFKTKEFEQDYKELYNQYLDIKEVKTFLVK